MWINVVSPTSLRIFDYITHILIQNRSSKRLHALFRVGYEEIFSVYVEPFKVYVWEACSLGFPANSLVFQQFELYINGGFLESSRDYQVAARGYLRSDEIRRTQYPGVYYEHNKILYSGTGGVLVPAAKDSHTREKTFIGSKM